MTSTVDPSTKTVVRDFARQGAERLSALPAGPDQDWEVEHYWQRDADGYFRERSKRNPSLLPVLNHYQSVPGYRDAVQALEADPLIGSHLNRLVGTEFSATRIEADNFLWALLYAMADAGGTFGFSDERFDGKWQELVAFCEADGFFVKTVVPIPYLSITTLPVRLNGDLVLDRLTDDEVTRCCRVGVLQPMGPGISMLSSKVAVGLRKNTWTRKVVKTADEPIVAADARMEGSFGKRPNFHDHLVVEDMLEALRLFKRGRVHASGFAHWVDYPRLSSGMSYRPMGQWPLHSTYSLSEDEIQTFLELWRQLETDAGRLSFPMHRFNLAFERGLPNDRIVDLVIAAESLFLSDVGRQDRGEVRFRFALRAAKFIRHPVYNEREVYRIMRRAYDARSSVVHGGAPESTALPDNPSAELSAFSDSVEELVRLALRKALDMKERAKVLRTPEYWEDLLFRDE